MDFKEVLTITIPSVLPTLMVLFGILSTKNDINHVRTQLSSIRGEISSVRGEISSVRRELSAEISSVRSELHADIMMLVNISNDLDKRVGRLEDKG